MATPDINLPFNDITAYVPKNLRNPVSSALIGNLFNKFMTRDESIPLFGYVGRKPSNPEDRTPRVPQTSVERDVNAVVPVINFKVGSEQHAFTVQDLVKKAQALGVDESTWTWLYTQGNNFLPPIDLDKFTNFFNYYWVGKALSSPPQLGWNPTLEPEYYVIATPKPSDLNKLNVVAASTGALVLTGTGFLEQTFTLDFTSPTTFTITPSAGFAPYTPVASSFTLTSNDQTINYVITRPGSTVTLVRFNIVREPILDSNGAIVGYSGFDAGDQYVIDTTFLSRNFTITFTGSTGIKGKIVGVQALSVYQAVDGVQLKAGDRILVKNNGSANGIYVVGPQDWTRAEDFSGVTVVAGARVWVRSGTVNGGKLFTSTSAVAWGAGVTSPSNTSPWQEGNLWVRGDELDELGLSRSGTVQALRPIIEYSADLELNAFVSGGLPSTSGTSYTQQKTRFNQVPLFNLYRYDGTHAALASSIFFYEEDPTADLDVVLQRRVRTSTNDSADFTFNHGCVDPETGDLLFYKLGPTLKTVWHPGYIGPTVARTKFEGIGNGTISVTAKDFTQQQIWTLTCTSPSTFSITGSKTQELPSPVNQVIVGTQYNSNDLAVLITAGSTLFEPGDTFQVAVGNLEIPRYVSLDESGNPSDIYGGPSEDSDGAWLVPRTFYHNPYNEAGASVEEGTLYSHFRGILSNQLSEPIDPAFGGSIKLWGEQHTLLASLLMQDSMTPISMIDFAQRQYDTALNSLRDIYLQNVVEYMGLNGAPTTDALLDALLEQRALDNDVRTVWYDSTSPVRGFPATLPMLAAAPLVQPEIGFDTVLGVELLTHHDGHRSPLAVDDNAFRDSILGSGDVLVERSDGSFTSAVGSFTSVAPVRPYRGELWLRPSAGELAECLVFDVKSDAGAPTSPMMGDRWYNRAINILSQWDGSSWVQAPVSSGWVVINLANVLNDAILAVEQRLHDGINPTARKFDFDQLSSEPGFQSQLERELFTFAAINGLDPLGSDYDATNAFTWNYSQATGIPGVPVSPARWFDVLTAHQDSVVGVIPTERPNLEPWKLFGFNTYATWWASLSVAQQASYTPYALPDQLPSFINAGAVRVVKTALGATALSGLQTIDGVGLNVGDRVLLVGETAQANNGVWVASVGTWTRAPGTISSDTYYTVLAGATGAGTVWVHTVSAPNINVDPIILAQVRDWSTALWTDVLAARPTLKISVNPYTDALLPPYASSIYALTNTIPINPSASYNFGDNGPVETVWERSIDYGYAQVRALFRFDPLAFIGFCWGFNWVEVDGIKYDGADVNMPGHKRFKLHGDLIEPVERVTPLTVASSDGNYTLTYDAYNTNRRQSFMVRKDGVVVGQAQEAVTSTVAGLVDIRITDRGVPFQIGDAFTVDAAGIITFVPTTKFHFQGFGQIFTHALREVSVDANQGYASRAYRGWDVNMGYRAGGLVATDDLKVFTNGETLSESSYTLLFKTNPVASNEWAQALRVTVQQVGEHRVTEAGVVATGDASDWVFRVEGYNPRYLGITHYELDPNGPTVSFNALSGANTNLAWEQPTTILDTISTQLPLVITGLQSVVDFMFGYSRYLEDRGWVFNNRTDFSIDAETGRAKDWQLEIEKMIDRMFLGIKPGAGHVLNPFMDRTWFAPAAGLVAPFKDSALFDITGHPGIFDTIGVRFKSSDLSVLRAPGLTEIGANAPMFSVHLQTEEYEHLFIFNNFSQPSRSTGRLYDPFSGGRVVTYKFKGRRQAGDTLRPDFGGHYLVGNEVRQNLQASTDNITQFYDANRVFENAVTTRNSLALLGFSTKEYFDNLDITDATQFNFWRGLIQAKGTNLSIDAFLNSGRFIDAKVDEYWAYKVAEYGDARQRDFPELKLSVRDTLQQFTQLQFDAQVGQELPNFTQISRFDEDRWFSIDDLDQDTYFKAEVVGTYSTAATTPGLLTLPFIADKLVINGTASVTQLNATTLDVGAGSLTVVGYGPATPRFNPVKLFNYAQSELVEEIPLWHPAANQHTPTALEGINVISNINPARFNYSTRTIDNANYDPLRPWGDTEVGRTWFDTRQLNYLPYYDPAIFPLRDERLSRWGTLADFGSIDVYEWVRSSVPPSEYDELAQLQAGDADIDPSVRASGQVANSETYVRDRTWQHRPIAWSFSPVPTAAAHPAFERAGLGTLHIDGSIVWLEEGTFEQLGITTGQRIGAFDFEPLTLKPLSEGTIIGNFGQVLSLLGPQPVVNAGSSQAGLWVPFNGTVEVTSIPGALSPFVGQLLFTTEVEEQLLLDADGLFLGAVDYRFFTRVTEVGSGDSVRILINTVRGERGADQLPPIPGRYVPVGVTIGVGTTFDLTEIGLRVRVIPTATATVDAAYLAESLAYGVAGNLDTNQSAEVSWSVNGTQAGIPSPTQLSNDPLDAINIGGGNGTIGWTSWTAPSQAQLNSDGFQPNSSWKPYVGDLIDFTPTLVEVQEAVSYQATPQRLNDGTIIERFVTNWTDWQLLSDRIFTSTATVAGPVIIDAIVRLEPTRTSVYVNGIAQLRASYELVGSVVTVNSVAVGSTVTVILRQYVPTTRELAFDPTVAEDLTFLQQYKQDFEYVIRQVRDADGSNAGTAYYFWVKNKTTPAVDKRLSVQSIAQELRSGPVNYLTFQHLIGAGSAADAYRFDAITIAGLSFVVTQDDAFKLRFTRNFTLRDDPQELDLKNTHAEWSLMRPGQKTRIPEALWNKLTDSVAGEDAAGNLVPSLRRVLYDERNGTATQFGFNVEQTLAPSQLLRLSITSAVLNTTLVDTSGSVPVPDYITALNFEDSEDWFVDAATSRATMTTIWTEATAVQVNAVFFAALEDILASNFALSDIFKTSRLSAYSIKTVNTAPSVPAYE